MSNEKRHIHCTRAGAGYGTLSEIPQLDKLYDRLAIAYILLEYYSFLKTFFTSIIGKEKKRKKCTRLPAVCIIPVDRKAPLGSPMMNSVFLYRDTRVDYFMEK